MNLILNLAIMKNLVLLITAMFLVGTTVNAATTSSTNLATVNTYVSGYGNSFIFVEGGIEFSVFPDGQFDFYIPQYGPNVSLGFSSPNVSISFNSGYNYSPYVQYDDFGAIIQIENVPIYYDYYGRITRVGSVNICYNNFGRVVWVGGLHIFYNRYNVFSHYTGYINVYNRYYVYRPWHRYYRAPLHEYCIVNTRPYRQYYKPVRYTYYRPYTNNYRPYTYSYTNSRRGVAESGRRTQISAISDRYRQEVIPRGESRRIADAQVRTSRKESSSSNTTTRRETVSRQNNDNVRKDIRPSQKRSAVVQGNKVNHRIANRNYDVNKSTNNPNRKPNVQKNRISSNERNNNVRRVTDNKSRKATVSKSSNSRENSRNTKPDLKRKKS